MCTVNTIFNFFKLDFVFLDCNSTLKVSENKFQTQKIIFVTLISFLEIDIQSHSKVVILFHRFAFPALHYTHTKKN